MRWSVWTVAGQLLTRQRPDPAAEIGRARLAICEKLARLGLLARLDDGAYALTARGREVADGVMAEFD